MLSGLYRDLAVLRAPCASVIRVAVLAVVAFFFGGCGQNLFRPMQAPEARIMDVTPVYQELKQLPRAVEPVVVAVYKFRDQTGQYKPTENGSSFSTAVTQGATSILIKALEDSGYFSPIERENVSNLLNERKIIRSTRTQYGNPEANEAQVLPPLLYAGILIEGGVVSYDANVLTGGAGARYFGAGVNARYRQDRVTIYLRAVSTSNGRILKTVNTSRTILSQALDGGLFRFVKFQRLLEAETGYTYNEPSEIAVREAIERAVQVLVLEGLTDGLWFTTDTLGVAKQQVEALAALREELSAEDVMGQYGLPERPAYQLGAFGQAIRYTGDFADGRYEYGVGLGLGHRISPTFGFGASVATGRLSTADLDFRQDIVSLGLHADLRPVPDYRVAPVLRAGVGTTLALGADLDRPNAERVVPNVFYGAGLEIQLNPGLEAVGMLGNHYLLTDRIDGEVQGKFNDWYLTGSLGLQFLLGRTKPDAR